MNYIDLIILLLLVLSAINGLRKGLVEELASLAALILGIWAALHFSGLTAGLLSDLFNTEGRYLPVIAFLFTFVLVLVLVNLAGHLVSQLVKAVHLGLLDRLAGFLFGFIKGALVLSVFLVIFNRINEDVHLVGKEATAGSRLYVPVRDFAPSVFPFLDFWGEIHREKTGDRLH